MNKQKYIETKNAPQAIGAYSQAVVFDKFIFVSGQIPLDPVTNKVVDGDITIQINQIFSNINEICKEAGSSIKDIIKFTVFLTDMDMAQNINYTINELFNYKNYPARSMVQVSRLPLNSKIEIECVCAKKK